MAFALIIHVTLKHIFDLFIVSKLFCRNLSQFIHAMFHSRVNFSFKGASKTNILLYLLNVTNIIDITSHAHFLIYHREHTLTKNLTIHDESYLTF